MKFNNRHATPYISNATKITDDVNDYNNKSSYTMHSIQQNMSFYQAVVIWRDNWEVMVKRRVSVVYA